MSEYLEAISRFASDLSLDQLPSKVVERAAEVTADTMAVVAAGGMEEEVKGLTAEILGEERQGPATLLFEGRKAPLLEAALLNGTAGTFLELDEGNQFGRGHPAVHVVPALLALGEALGAKGSDYIPALVAGYEIGTRIGIAAKIRMSMHPHGTWGTVGAAVAAARLAGVDSRGMKEIINISSSLALATSRKTMLEGATVRNVYSGVSNHMGLLALKLYQSGFTGEADGLSTVYGSVISEVFDTESMTEELGVRFEIARNYFKRHAACRYTHSALDALEIIAGRFPDGRIPVEQVEEVTVETYSLAAQLSNQHPSNMLAAKFSIPFAAATFMIHGRAGVECFRTEKVGDKTIQALAGRITVSEDPELTAMMPGKRPSRVTIRLKDGSEHRAETYVNKGDFEDPYPREELIKKYYELAESAWGRDKAEAVYERIQGLPEIDSLTELTAPLSHQ
ncbi:MAG: MmgE/PrpD family protein [Desulfobacteraceae bacterium]